MSSQPLPSSSGDASSLRLFAAPSPGDPSEPALTLEEFLDQVYVPHHLGIEPGTITQYRGAIHLLNAHAGHAVRTDELGEALIVGLLSALLSGKFDGTPRSPATVNSKRASLRALWRFAHRRSQAAEPMTLPRAKTPKRKPRAWTLAEMERIVTSCYAAPSRRGWEGAHWVAVVMTIYDTALRISALLQVRTSDLCLTRGLLRADAEEAKDDEEQVFTLHPQTLACLRDALAGGPRELVFPWPFHKRQIWPQFRRILDAAGLPHGRRDLFHKIRRTSGSWLESVRGGAATAHLGHSDRATTVAGYLDPAITGVEVNAAELLPRFEVRRPDPQKRLF